MFRRLNHRDGRTVTFSFQGKTVEAREGDTVAAALLAAQVPTFRETPVAGSPRGPYCMMGVCFDCLLTIDGEANRQGCLTLVADGMTVERQAGRRILAASGKESDDA